MEISDEELAKIEKSIVEGLPILLEKKPEIKMVIYRILAKEFPTRTEISEFVDEMRKSRIQFEEERKNQFKMLYQGGEKLDKQGEDLKEIRTDIKSHGETLGKHGEMLEKHGADLKDIKNELTDHRTVLKRLDKGIGTIGRKIGADLEKLTRNIYLETLKKENISIQKIKRGEKIKVDEEEFEIDIYSENTTIILFETKYSATLDDATEFFHKIELIQKVNPSKRIRAFLIAVNTLDDIDGFCKQHNISLITSKI